MRTAIELADNLEHGYPSKERMAAAAMLRTLAQEIESLKVDFCKQLDGVSTRNYALRKENEALHKANLDCMAYFNQFETDYDALKADAERFVILSEYLMGDRNFTFDDLINEASSLDEMRSAIDAMKGAT